MENNYAPVLCPFPEEHLPDESRADFLHVSPPERCSAEQLVQPERDDPHFRDAEIRIP